MRHGIKKDRKGFCPLAVFLTSKPVSRVLSFKTAIYLDVKLPPRSSRPLNATGPVYCVPTALLRIEFTATDCSQPSGELLPRLSILTACWGRRSISVALSLGSPPAAVSSCHASVKPGLSSGRSSRPAVVCSTRLCIIIPYFCIICNCCFFVL